MADTTNDLTNFVYENNCIPPNLYPKVMRACIEDKALLSGYGYIYYGTGETQKVEIDGQTAIIPITNALVPPKKAGTYVLTCIVGSDGAVTKFGWVATNTATGTATSF